MTRHTTSLRRLLALAALAILEAALRALGHFTDKRRTTDEQGGSER